MRLALPRRRGERPVSHYGLPHRQLDQVPSAEVYARTVERFLAMDGARRGESLISVPGAQALFLPAGAPCNPAHCMPGREFAHIHPPSDGGFHVILESEDCAHVLEQGWGELHPLAAAGKIQPTTLLIYAARDEVEIDVVLAITRAAYRHATAGGRSYFEQIGV